MKLKDLFLIERKSHDENDDINKSPPLGGLGEYITTAQAAKELGVTMGRIRQFIMDGRLQAKSPEKGRRDNLIKLSDLNKFKKIDREITGRPPEKEESKA